MHALLLAEAENNFFFGSTAEMVVSAIASIIVIGLLIWKAGPPAKAALAARSDRIAKEIEDSAKAHADADAKLADVQTRIANSEQERQRILVEARQTAEALKQQIIAKADEDAIGLKARAVTDIEASKQQAIADLQAEVAALALGAAEEVIARSLDASTQSELIDGYISQVGAQS